MKLTYSEGNELWRAQIGEAEGVQSPDPREREQGRRSVENAGERGCPGHTAGLRMQLLVQDRRLTRALQHDHADLPCLADIRRLQRRDAPSTCTSGGRWRVVRAAKYISDEASARSWYSKHGGPRFACRRERVRSRRRVIPVALPHGRFSFWNARSPRLREDAKTVRRTR